MAKPEEKSYEERTDDYYFDVFLSPFDFPTGHPAELTRLKNEGYSPYQAAWKIGLSKNLKPSNYRQPVLARPVPDLGPPMPRHTERDFREYIAAIAPEFAKPKEFHAVMRHCHYYARVTNRGGETQEFRIDPQKVENMKSAERVVKTLAAVRAREPRARHKDHDRER